MTDNEKPKDEQPSDSSDKEGTEESSQKAISDPLKEDDQDTTGITLLPDEYDEEDKEQEETVILPTFPESVYAGLPEFLKRVVSIAISDEERDVLLLGSIVVLGAGMPNFFGIYDGMEVRPNLYLFVTAKASAGKGILNWCKHLVNPIHSHLRRQYAIQLKEHARLTKEYHSNKLKDPNLELPQKPQEQMFFIPANSTSTGMYELLSKNNGQGLIFETEGDTLSYAFKSKYGDYSDGYRKAFHHESISYYRRTDHEYVDIESPGISSVLAGTPNQVTTLIPGAENGLFSRYIFYYMNINPVWKDVFAVSGGISLNKHFDRLGAEFFKLYETLNASELIQFSLTEKQVSEFYLFFSQIQDKYLTLQGMAYMAVIRRLGLIAFRIAMVFTALRMLETGNYSRKQECREDDFHATLSMITILIKHSSYVFTQLREPVKRSHKINKKEQFFEKLPATFNHSEYITIAKELGIKERSAEGYMKAFCEINLIRKEQRDKYINLTLL